MNRAGAGIRRPAISQSSSAGRSANTSSASRTRIRRACVTSSSSFCVVRSVEVIVSRISSVCGRRRDRSVCLRRVISSFRARREVSLFVRAVDERWTWSSSAVFCVSSVYISAASWRCASSPGEAERIRSHRVREAFSCVVRMWFASVWFFNLSPPDQRQVRGRGTGRTPVSSIVSRRVRVSSRGMPCSPSCLGELEGRGGGR